jgi:hypothetical protein
MNTVRPVTDELSKAYLNFIGEVAAARPTHMSARFVVPADHELRGDHCVRIVKAAKIALKALVEDAGTNDPTGIIEASGLVTTIDACLSDLAGDIGGTFEKTAEQMRSDRAA